MTRRVHRRGFLVALGTGFVLWFPGCVGESGEATPGSGGDPGRSPVAELRMEPVTDAEIARRVTYRLDRDHRRSEREVAVTAIADGSATVEGTSPPVPADRPFVFDGSVYELDVEVVESTPATAFRVTFTGVDGDVPGDETIAYDELPGVDRSVLERYGWDDGPPFELTDVPVRHRDGAIDESVLVPTPTYPVVEWDDARGRITVEEPTDVELKTYRYSASPVHESASGFGRSIREDRAFALDDLPDDQERIVSEAIADGYVRRDGDPPPAFDRLADRFASRRAVTKVYRESDDATTSGRYLVRYDGEVYWTELHVDE